MLQFENERNLEVVVIARVLIQTNGIIAFDLFDPILGGAFGSEWKLSSVVPSSFWNIKEL